MHDGGTSLGNLRVALACEARRLIPYNLYHTLHVRRVIEITLCQLRYRITPGVGDPCRDSSSWRSERLPGFRFFYLFKP
jgi:hypothetical protein